MIGKDYEDEIMKCWTVSDGLKGVIDGSIKALNTPDTQKSEYKKMRAETVYPAIATGLSNCPNASAAWKDIYDAIEKCDWAMKEDLWDHCYLHCPSEQAKFTREWNMHMYNWAG